MKENLNNLEKISEITLDASMAALRAMRQKQSVHKQEIQRLRAARNKVTPFTSDIGMMIQAQQTERWKQWCQSEIIRQNTALAALSAEAEELEAAARKHFGRRKTIKKLQTAMQKDQNRRLKQQASQR